MICVRAASDMAHVSAPTAAEIECKRSVYRTATSELAAGCVVGRLSAPSRKSSLLTGLRYAIESKLIRAQILQGQCRVPVSLQRNVHVYIYTRGIKSRTAELVERLQGGKGERTGARQAFRSSQVK